jgi:flavin-dependent dehydrogenase
VGDAKGWVWTAMVQPGLYQWTRIAADGSLPHPGWLPLNLRRLTPVEPSRGADVTWRMAAHTAHPAWFIVGDAACQLDPLSSKGVLRAMMSGIAAGHLIASVLDERIAADAAANVYQHWLFEWFVREALHLAAFYRQLGIAGFAADAELRSDIE